MVMVIYVLVRCGRHVPLEWGGLRPWLALRHGTGTRGACCEFCVFSVPLLVGWGHIGVRDVDRWLSDGDGWHVEHPHT